MHVKTINFVTGSVNIHKNSFENDGNHLCYGQRAGWIKMPLGTEPGLCPGDIALDVDPAPPKKGHSPHFLARLLWPNGAPISATAEYL